MLDQVVLPKKGRLSVADRQIEYSEDFIASRHQHAAVESAINALENHGLDRCLDHGIDGFNLGLIHSPGGRNPGQNQEKLWHKTVDPNLFLRNPAVRLSSGLKQFGKSTFH